VDAKKQTSLFISLYQYEAAIAVITEMIGTLPAAEQEVWNGLREVLQGYLAWDNFHYPAALRHLGSGVKRLEMCVKFHVDPSIAAFFHKVSGNFITLSELRDATKSFTVLHPLLVRDLVSNAARRGSQRQYDEALARLHRALEMAGQIAFREKTGCDPSRVSPERVPECLRDEYARRYARCGDVHTLNLPLRPTFAALKEMGHPTGRGFFDHEDELDEVLSAWEVSLLGGGAQPIDREIYEEFAELMEELFLDAPLIEFVKW